MKIKTNIEIKIKKSKKTFKKETKISNGPQA